MLAAKKERMERLIASIDNILKGENKMDFAVFSKTETDEKYGDGASDFFARAIESFYGKE